ncbi:MAG: KpsF/GutQ family sugar-phosphate isomerase [Flavobacteriia bacterium]|nr:KpsF/GutQ family sugar-phosphate isomerase [Flavobacteriia bacterium]
MNLTSKILESATRTFQIERDAIQALIPLLNSDFEQAVETIFKASGRVVITGIGKSAIIANKIVATLNSTGTPAIFMHAADAIHGDLGNIQNGDPVICISKSGNTPEIKVLVPLLKRGNNPLIAITGNLESFLAQQADFVLNTTVEQEACPNNLAPTTSTTAQLVMGDALAVCLLELRGFKSNDFAKYHPGGALGKKLYLRVADILKNNAKPSVQPNSPVKEVILEISKSLLGVAAVIEGERIVGIVTDGDIRRMLNTHDNIGPLRAKDIMSLKPKTIEADHLAVSALKIMQEHQITQLLAVEKERYLGVVHLHNLIQEGIV